MAEIEKLELVEDGLSLLLPQFQESTNIKGLLRSVFEVAQGTEDGILDVFQGSGLDNATGYTLDLIGELVGVSRARLDDSTYRSAIRVRISINRSTGTIPDIISLIGLVTDNSDFDVIEYYPAEVHVRLKSPQDVITQNFIDDVTPAGVGGVVLEDPDGEVFTPVELDLVFNAPLLSDSGVLPELSELPATNKTMSDLIITG
jgi:hypothetical protein